MEVLNITEAAKFIGCSVSQLRVWKRSGGGPKFFQKGKLLRYRLCDLKEFVRENSSE